MDENREPMFSSDHLYIVAFLVCMGREIIGTTRHGGRVKFEFKETPELNADVARFMGGAAVPARKFCFELLKLKRTLHGVK